MGVSDKFSLRFLCLEVELLHRNKSPEKSHKKHQNSALCPPRFSKNDFLVVQKKHSSPQVQHSPLTPCKNSLISPFNLSPRGDNFWGMKNNNLGDVLSYHS